ncbi:hypothetical protein ISCGN_028526 [Ixodes scapularis]
MALFSFASSAVYTIGTDMTTPVFKAAVFWLSILVIWQMVVTSSCRSLSEAVEERAEQSVFDLFSQFMAGIFTTIDSFITRLQETISGSSGT